MTKAAAGWGQLLERGSLNEIRCALIEIAADDPQGEELHYRLMEVLEAMFERGLGAGKAETRGETVGAGQAVRVASVSPTDSRRIMVLGSLMFAASKQWLPNACEVLLPLVCGLMQVIREDYCNVGAEEVVDRLLAIADRRIGIEELARAALAEMRAVPVSGAPS
jgi:hypothetical protein